MANARSVHQFIADASDFYGFNNDHTLIVAIYTKQQVTYYGALHNRNDINHSVTLVPHAISYLKGGFSAVSALKSIDIKTIATISYVDHEM